MLTEAEHEQRLSRPTPGSIRAMRELGGDLLILGVSGKMGPSLAALARRSAEAAGRGDLRIIGVARYSTPGSRKQMEAAGGTNWVEAKRSDDSAAERWQAPSPRRRDAAE